MSIEMIEEEGFNLGTQIKVIGVGGGGGNAVEHMIGCDVQGVEFICANTDAQALSRSVAHKTIQLGSSGLGAGSKPDKGRDSAELAIDDIRAAIDGAHMLFITAGMGGGTGTGAAPVIARVAKEMGILTVGVVTKPFDWEGGRRMTNADNGLADRRHLNAVDKDLAGSIDHRDRETTARSCTATIWCRTRWQPGLGHIRSVI